MKMNLKDMYVELINAIDQLALGPKENDDISLRDKHVRALQQLQQSRWLWGAVRELPFLGGDGERLALTLNDLYERQGESEDLADTQVPELDEPGRIIRI